MYYDRKRGFWDDYACQRNPGGRCVKMDCHEPNTHFSLLGFFKEPGYDQWMEQLFKHEGDCVWSDEEYSFMQQNRGTWPNQCTQSTVTDENGNYLYYDTKPGEWGTMFIGLYTDYRCIDEYSGAVTAEEVLTLMSADGDNQDVVNLEEQLATWNKAFNVFKYCQPCKAYDLVSIIAGSDAQRNSTGTRYQNYGNNQQQGGGGGDDGFQCYDAAGYTDVNQCMKFKTKTNMLTASISDVLLAEMQGTVTGVALVNKTYGEVKQKNQFQSKTIQHQVTSFQQKSKQPFTAGFSPDELKRRSRLAKFNTFFLIFSSVLFGTAAAFYYDARRRSHESVMEEPLVTGGKMKHMTGVML